MPGGDWVAAGLRDLANGEVSIPSALVSIGAVRLAAAGLTIPRTGLIPAPERTLYALLAAESRAGQYKYLDVQRAVAHLHGMVEAMARK